MDFQALADPEPSFEGKGVGGSGPRSCRVGGGGVGAQRHLPERKMLVTGEGGVMCACVKLSSVILYIYAFTAPIRGIVALIVEVTFVFSSIDLPVVGTEFYVMFARPTQL